jgi:hypothetical protein
MDRIGRIKNENSMFIVLVILFILSILFESSLFLYALCGKNNLC